MVSLHLLGPLQVENGGKIFTSFRSNRAVALLAYLVCRQRPVSRSELVELIWPDRPEAKGQANLRWALNYLGTLLPGCWESNRQTICFLAERAVVDLNRLRLSYEQAAWSDLTVVLANIQGDFMHGFYFDESPEFEIWLLAQREHWQQKVVQALQSLITYHTKRGEYSQGLDLATRLITLEPWREEVHRQIMTLQIRTGQRSAALAQYKTCCRILAETLEVEPEPETTTLYQRIKAAVSTRLHNLPLQPTSFVGREAELAELHLLLANPDCRLLTLVGMGGIGKSRLAVHVAELVANDQKHMFLHGVVFVALAAVNSADFLVSTVARELGFSFRDREAPEQQLLNYLRDKELLLLLDNYEHLLPETGVLARLFQAARDVKVMVTSRRPLNLREEWRFEVEGLAYPTNSLGDEDLAELRSFSAIRLFEAGARRVQPGFSLAAAGPEVIHICRLVDGMPLALELAACRLDAFTSLEIAGNLERNLDILATSFANMPARHRSLSAVFEWSWLTLTPDERMIMEQASIFRGGFTREAAVRVTGASPAVLASLVSKSLLRLSATGRYDSHALLRQFAGEKLQESAQQEAVRDRHLAYFLALALAAEPHLEGRDQLSWLERLKADQYNLAAALQWAWDQERSESVAQMSGALGGFWSIHGFMSEGKQWLTAVLSQRHQLTAATLAQVLFASGWLAFERGDHAEARRFYEESLALWRDIDDKPKVAKLLNRLGHAVQQQGEFAETTSLYEESLALYEALGDKIGVALALNRLGHLAQLQGDNVNAVRFLERSLAWRRELDDKRGMASSLNALAETIRYQGDFLRAAVFYEESLDLCRQLGDKRCVASVGHNLGYVALYQADYERAGAFFKDSLYLFQELENRGGVALCLAGLAAVLGAQARPVQAAQLFGASEALLAASYTSLSPTDQQAWDQNVALVRSQLEEGAFIIAHASGRFMSVEQALKLVSICSSE